MSPSPPPCPPPNIPSLWGNLANINHLLGPPPPAHSFFNASLAELANFQNSMASIQIPNTPQNHTPVSPPPSHKSQVPLTFAAPPTPPGIVSGVSENQLSKYNQLLLVLDDMSKDVRPSYAGNKSSMERLRRGIAHARFLVHEALVEAERLSRN